MEAGSLGLPVHPSMIKHKKPTLEDLSESPFAENSLVAYYYGIFVYGNLGGRSSIPKSYNHMVRAIFL